MFLNTPGARRPGSELMLIWLHSATRWLQNKLESYSNSSLLIKNVKCLMNNIGGTLSEE